MLFDPGAFQANVREISRHNDPDELEGYLLEQIVRLNDGGTIAAGAACPAGKDEEALLADEAAFQANRNQGYILCYTELANLYRSLSAWSRCFDVYSSLSELIRAEGLTDTPVGLSSMLNEAYARIDAGEAEKANDILDRASRVKCEDAHLLCMLHDARSALCATSGDLNGAREASELAVSCASGITDAAEYAGMMLNHAATLARVGDVAYAIVAIDALLARADVTGEQRWQALNFKAKASYQEGNYVAAADSLATLIGEAREAGALSAQVPSLCQSCGEMYRLAGMDAKADEYRELSATLRP